MTEADLILMSIDLLKSIEQNDLEKTKLLVNTLNENFKPVGGINSLDLIIPLNEMISENLTNESFIYVVNNLKHFLNLDQIKWYINIQSLRLSDDFELIAQFIENEIANNNVKDYQIINLISLCVKIKRYDLLDDLSNIVKNF
jgi:hypothetical protein